MKGEKSKKMEEEVNHTIAQVNGINMHYAHQGEGPPILFLHGFPELWYSWRHQISGLADLGYRCIAPDLRGFGQTDAPPLHTSYTVFHIVGDLIALLDVLGLEKVFVVGHDWGAFMAWYLCLFRPDRVIALVNLSVPFRVLPAKGKASELLRAAYGDDYYMCRFQKPGEAEAEFSTADPSVPIKMFHTYRTPAPIMIPKGSVANAAKNPIPLPSWLTEENVKYYADNFERSGFTGGFNYYRAIDLNLELLGAWTGAKVNVPTKFIVGELDLVYHMPGAKEYIDNVDGKFKEDVPLLREVVVMPDAAHFINQEKGDEITAHIYEFIKMF